MANRLVVTCIRHGITRWNEERRYLGWSDLPLSEVGRAEVQSWTAPHVDFIVTSDLRRASETAEILYKDRPKDKYPAFREYHFGDWEGKTYEELKDDHHYRKWLENPIHIVPPNGESFHAFSERVVCGWRAFLLEIMEKGVTSSLLVAHGGTIRQILSAYSSKKFWEWEISHGTGIELVLECEGQVGGKGEFRCISLQAVHLMGKGIG